MSDVILVQPKTGEWDDIRSRPALPLALLHAATLVDEDYKIRLIDQRTEKNWEKTLGEELNRGPLCVGFTSMTGLQIKHALSASRIVKEESDVPVVWGGVHPSLLPVQTLENENVDIVVQGEGEYTFRELVDAIAAEKSLYGIKGLWFKEDGKIKKNPERQFAELNELPDVPYHLVKMREYMPEYMGKATVNMQTSRGCPYNCAFCYNNIYNKRRWRALSSEKVLERIKTVVELGAEGIYFVDDEFFLDMRRGEEIARGLIKEKIDIEWQVQGVDINVLDMMDARFIQVLENSGCVRFFLGLESGSPRILKLIRKRHTPAQAVLVNRKMKDFDIKLYYNLITGFPTETLDEIRMTVQMIFKLLKENPNARITHIYNYLPYPGTEMFDLAVQHGFEPPFTLDGWQGYNFGNINLPYLSPDRRDMLESLYISTAFLDGKFLEYDAPYIIKLLAELYKPLARFRTKNLFFNFMIEKKLNTLFLKKYQH